MFMLWGRALSLKEIWHGNCIVPEVRLLTLCSRMQHISFKKETKLLSIILLGEKTHLSGRDSSERKQIPNMISFLESNIKV